MKKTTRTAAIASVLAAGIAGLTLSAPLALAAPTPSAPSTPKAGSAAPTKTQVRVQLTPPRTSTSPVVVTLSGLRPSAEARLTVALWRTDDPGDSVARKVAADGTVTLSVPAPKTGWPKPGEGGIAGDLVATVRQSGSQEPVWRQVFKVTGDRSEASGKDASGGLAKTGV